MKKALLVDEDGSFVGGLAPVSVFSQSEWEWNGDKRRGLGDYRIPKVMLTSMNGSRLPIDKVAPHKGKVLCNKHVSFTLEIDHHIVFSLILNYFLQSTFFVITDCSFITSTHEELGIETIHINPLWSFISLRMRDMSYHLTLTGQSLLLQFDSREIRFLNVT